MNMLDLAVIVVVIISVGVGIFRGAIREVLNIAGWLMAFILAHTYASELAKYFADWASEPVLREVSAWLAIFLGVLIGTSLLASLLSGMAKKMGLSSIDRGLGAAIGLARGGVIVLGVTLAVGLTTLPQASTWRTATVTPWLEAAALYSRNMLPDSIAARIRYRVPPASPVSPSSTKITTPPMFAGAPKA
jgi:membrane protein required for colicin V production